MTRIVFSVLVALGLGATAAAQQTTPPIQFTHAPSFKAADKNGDGRVNRSEADAIPGLDFTLADANGDRVLTRQEFADAVAGFSASGEQLAGGNTAQVPFEQADKNQDGKVDPDEARDIDGFNFAAADSDADRALTRAEYRTAMIESRQRG